MKIDWSRIKGRLRKGAHYSNQKIKEYSHIGRIKMDVARTEHAMRQSYLALGQKAYDLVAAGKVHELGNEAGAQVLIQDIKRKEAKVLELQGRLAEATGKALSSETDVPAEATPATVSENTPCCD